MIYKDDREFSARCAEEKRTGNLIPGGEVACHKKRGAAWFLFFLFFVPGRS
jgi:hypothetical protein